MPAAAARIGVPAGHADVDARVAGLPGPALAELRGDRPVDRPDEAAVALLDRPRGERALRLLQRGLDLGLLGLQPGEVALELLALGAHRAQGARLVGARAGQADLGVDEALLGAGDLVAALLDDRGELLLAALEDVQALGGRRRVGLGGAHDPDDVLVLLGHALHELAALEQLGEALGGHDHRDDVGRVGLVELDEALGERRAGLRQAGAQAHEAPALGAQVALGLEQLVALGVEVGLGVGLLALQRADAALQAPDALRVGADLRGQQALGALALADLALRDPDLVLDVAQATGRRRGALGEDRQGSPERERQDRTREQDAKTHAAAHATSAIGQGST